jgi:siderophore synthetase component/RimJ/RimL family protein N-acetyltransferase
MLMRSEVGRHRYAWPMVLQTASATEAGHCAALSPGLARALVLEALAGLETAGGEALAAELGERVAQSTAVQTTILQRRWSGLDAVFAAKGAFLAAEQDLLLGHPLHPTPKSRTGIRPDDLAAVSPETRGAVRLHFLALEADAVHEASAIASAASELVRDLLVKDACRLRDKALLDTLERTRARVLVPMHPLEADAVWQVDAVRALVAAGRAEPLGPLGDAWLPTSSVRTLAHPVEPWMIKLSLSVAITNSKRINQERELLRSVEAHRLINGTALATELRETAPTFDIITDPAVLAVAPDGKIVERLACTLRPNPFGTENAAVLATLAQDHPAGGKSRLAAIVAALAERTGRDAASVAAEWYDRFLATTVAPILSIYIRHGIALEAHQQNLVLTMDEDGWPARARYRDNQGIFHRDTAHDDLTALLPGIGEDSGSIGPEALVDERLGYYLVYNSAFGMANALAWQCDVPERLLLELLRRTLERLAPLAASEGRSVVTHLLESPALAFKANLLTRARGMDELVGDPRFQSVYVPQRNPLFKESARRIVDVRDDRLGCTFRFRELDPERDLDLYCRWMSQPHVAKWWALARTREALALHLQKHQANTNQTLYLGFVDGKPMSYWERYWVGGDVAGKYVEHDTFDQGMHFLIGDPAYGAGKYAHRMIVAFSRLCFEAELRTERVIGEPDARNDALIRHAAATGYDRIGTVRLPDKTAAIMITARADHYARFADVRTI